MSYHIYFLDKDRETQDYQSNHNLNLIVSYSKRRHFNTLRRCSCTSLIWGTPKRVLYPTPHF